MPTVVKRVDPVYPALALQARIQGVVKLNVTIATDGSVKEIFVASGHPLLIPAALQAAKEWTFQPPVSELTSLVEIAFTLPPGLPPGDSHGAGKADNAATPMPTPLTIKVGPNVQHAMLLHKVDPVYPAQARAAGIEGSVSLTVRIGEDGQVQSADPTDGNPILAAAAQEAVRQWGYKPTLLNGKPVSVVTTVVVPFHLQ
jgi:TonB family protein